MSRPSQLRARRGIRAETAQLAQRGRPPKKPEAPAAAPAKGTAPAAGPVAAAVAQPPSENQGQQFGLMTRALVAPMYLAVVGAELPPAAWQEWGVAAARCAMYYSPTLATHPGTQLAACTLVLALPLALAWPGYTARRAAARKAAAEAAARERNGQPAAPAEGAPPAEPRRGPTPGHTIGGGWGGNLPKPGS